MDHGKAKVRGSKVQEYASDDKKEGVEVVVTESCNNLWSFF